MENSHKFPKSIYIPSILNTIALYNNPRSYSNAMDTYLFVVVVVLVVVVRFQREFCSAFFTLETAGMEKGKILEGPHAVHLVDNLVAP